MNVFTKKNKTFFVLPFNIGVALKRPILPALPGREFRHKHQLPLCIVEAYIFILSSLLFNFGREQRGKMSEQNSKIKSPDEIFRNKKRAARDHLRLAVYELPPDYFTVTLADPRNAVLITEGEAGREAYFVYGRFKSKELQRREGLSHNQPNGAAGENDFAETTPLATFSLSPDSDEDDDEPDVQFDRFAFCAWKSKPEGFENAAGKFENLGARRLAGDELANELNNFGLSWILGYELTAEESQKIIDQD